MTGLPVRRAKPAGEARSAPTVATPTTPGSQPTPARTRSRFSIRDVLQHLAELGAQAFGRQPRGLGQKLVEVGPCRAMTPSSAKISCWRMRCCSARSVTSGLPSFGGSSTTGSSEPLAGLIEARFLAAAALHLPVGPPGVHAVCHFCGLARNVARSSVSVALVGARDDQTAPAVKRPPPSPRGLHQLDETHVRAVEGVVSGRRAGSLGFAAQRAVHGKTLLQHGRPFGGQVLHRRDGEPAPSSSLRCSSKLYSRCTAMPSHIRRDRPPTAAAPRPSW